MEVNLSTQRELARWYKLKDHVKQQALITDTVRFKCVPAGRRSGKTERAKRFIAKIAMANPGEEYFIAAPTRDQVKKIYWSDMKRLTFQSLQLKQPSETELIITLNNGSRIHLIGLDRPERMEGQFWSGGVIDEIANIKETAWAENIKPALDTWNPTRPDYRAWCWLIGVPEGLNHYYEMCEYARNSGDPDWKEYAWFSSDILPPDIIEAAKRQMSLRQYRQEYEASFETTTGRIYDDYGQGNLTGETILSHEQLWWHHDFNFTPMSSGIAVRRLNHATGLDSVLILDEIILTSAIARQSAIEFCERYKEHQNRHVMLYGDPAGRAGEKHGHESDYTEIEGVLRSNGWSFERCVKNAAPAIRDRQNAVRAKVANAAGQRSLFVNAARAPYAHKGLATVSVKAGSSFQEEVSEYQHITTAIGYMVDYVWPTGGEMLKIGIAGN